MHQKYCIYGLRKQDSSTGAANFASGNSKSVDASSTGDIEKFFQIRVKSIEFLNKPAIAVYFYDVTKQVDSIKLGTELKQQESKNNVVEVS